MNGKEYRKSFITYKDIMKGGELFIKMGASPSQTWGVKQIDRPRSEIK
jgi:putative alpha-1,2-mannosidase